MTYVPPPCKTQREKIKKEVFDMKTKVKDLTVKELCSLIYDTIKETMEDIVEDLLFPSNLDYINSVKKQEKIIEKEG